MKLAQNLNYEFSFLRLQVQYCCASDKYRRGPKMETFLQGWKSGAAAVKSVFRKYEHDWTTVSLISYLLHEKCRCYSPLTSRVTESNLKNFPFYSLYSYLTSCQSSPFLLPLTSLHFLFYFFPPFLFLLLFMLLLYALLLLPLSLFWLLYHLLLHLFLLQKLFLFFFSSSSSPTLTSPCFHLHLYPLCTPSVPPSVPPSVSHLCPFCTPSLPHLYPFCTPSVPHLYPFCTPSVPHLYPHLYPFCTPSTVFLALYYPFPLPLSSLFSIIIILKQLS